MKLRPVTLLGLFVFASVAVSCGRSSDSPEVVKPDPVLPVIPPVTQTQEIIKFQYDNKSAMENNVLYVGPTGEKKQMNMDFVNKKWSNIVPYFGQPIFDTKNKKLSVTLSSSATAEYTYSQKQDSLFIDRNGNNTFIGFFNAQQKTLKLKQNYSAMTMMQRGDGIYDGFKSFRRNDVGVLQYKNMFHENSFKSEKEMTIKGDTIFWANFAFEYREIK